MARAAISALSYAELPAPDAEMLTLQPLPRFRFNINDVVPRSKRGDERCQRFNESP